jgi:hypothetical protein
MKDINICLRKIKCNSGKNLPYPIFLLILVFSVSLVSAQSSKPIPHLQKKGSSSQLIVDGKPFLILGGETGNSSSSSSDYMNPIWSDLEGSFREGNFD